MRSETVRRDGQRGVPKRAPGIAWTALLLLLPLAVVLPSVGQAQEAEDYARVLERHAPALVSLTFLLEVQLGGEMAAQAGELPDVEGEITGMVVDPAGLVVCSNSQLNGLLDLVKRLAGPAGAQLEMTLIPKDLKVLWGDGEELAADLVVRDSDLDLAWVKIRNPDGRVFPAVDLAGAEAPEPGQPVMMLKRLDRGFGRATTFLETRVAARVERPRVLYVPAGQVAGFGLPVFDLAGDLVGITVIQLPDSLPDMSNPLAMMLRTIELQQNFSGLILSAPELAAATALAREMAAEMEPPEEEGRSEGEEGEETQGPEETGEEEPGS